jgi:membrane fusion protein, multidrug efflux system
MQYIPTKTVKKRPALWIALAAIIGTGGYYTLQSFHGSNAQDMAATQAIPVNVITMKPQSVQIWQEFSGHTRAVDYAQIRPEVSGRITEIRFQDGDEVKKGQILLVIDPRQYEAALSKAKANVQSATTTAHLATREAERANQMYKNHAITQSQRDQRVNEQKVANANLQAAKAELKQAQLDVEHAYVRSPFAGRVSRAEITVGNVVQSGLEAPLLTSVVSNKAIYADFELDESTYLDIVSQQTDHKQLSYPIELKLKNGKDKVYKSQQAVFDNHIDTNSGTIRARATFTNDDGILIPGMFVTIRLGATHIPQALLVPERAIGTDQNKKFIFVVGTDNKVQYREVSLGSTIKGDRVITAGIVSGEKVIVDGIQHVRPDAVVNPTETSTATSPASKPKA